MNTSKKVIIILMIVGCLVASYLYISKSTSSEAAITSSLISSNDENKNAEAFNDQLASDTAFLSTLVTLKQIKIDTSLFTNELFTILADNAVKIDTVEPGRPNPFASIGIDSSIKTPTTDPKEISKSVVITNDATNIKTKTAILNASVNTTEPVTNSYFEYGTSELLENKTPQVTKTQAGTYSINITNLQSKTTYYFRAASIINGNQLYGEVNSFVTN